MPIHPLKRIEDRLRNGVMMLDYGIYGVINLFKWKKFPEKVNRVLVVEMLQLGDLLVATPVLKALKEKYKKAQIDVLLSPGTQQLLQGNKHVNKIIPYTTWNEVIGKIKEQQYDLGIILHPGSWKISSLLLLGGVKYRIGAAKVGIFSGKGFFLNKKIKPKLQWQHKIEDNLDVIRSLGIHPKERPKIEVTIDQKADKIVTQFLKRWRGKKIIVHTASKNLSNRWMPERFARLTDALIAKYKAIIFFTGTRDDYHNIEYIRQHIREKKNTHNIAGRTTLPQLIALVNRVDLVITIDTSMTHITSGTKTPLVVLFGRDLPAVWGPSSKNNRYIWKEKEACVGCRRTYCVYKKNYECMRSIYESEVLEKVAEIFP